MSSTFLHAYIWAKSNTQQHNVSFYNGASADLTYSTAQISL